MTITRKSLITMLKVAKGYFGDIEFLDIDNEWELQVACVIPYAFVLRI